MGKSEKATPSIRIIVKLFHTFTFSLFHLLHPIIVTANRAEVAKLVDALVLGTSVERHASSSLALGTSISCQWSVASCQPG